MEAEINDGDPTEKIGRRKIQALFKYMDAGHGSYIFSDERIRRIVENTIAHGNGKDFVLHAAVISCQRDIPQVRIQGEGEVGRRVWNNISRLSALAF